MITLSLYLSLTATIFVYAFLMGVLKKEPSQKWLKYTSLLTLIFTAAAFSLNFKNIVDDSSVYQFLAAFMLVFSLGNALALVFLAKKLGIQTEELSIPSNKQKIAKLLSSTIFLALILNMLLTLAHFATL